MGLEDLNVDFDVAGLIEGIRLFFLNVVKTIFMIIFNLPMWVKITISIFFILSTIGIAYLTWKYREEWKYVEY